MKKQLIVLALSLGLCSTAFAEQESGKMLPYSTCLYASIGYSGGSVLTVPETNIKLRCVIKKEGFAQWQEVKAKTPHAKTSPSPVKK